MNNASKIEFNIFTWNNKFFYYEQISLSFILRKIFIDGYQIEDVKGYLIPAFKWLKGILDFF